ncbi:PEGA domain-containing protein [Fodinibius sediminis]|uniref:PEGA domain-containing protein n=1 Tax=Fodinibius sediminis TaxID=1214077 RepID=A0A521ENH2_9BACT|nr:PEGA domain-containing protein [Fodinibius sediminis]SMO84680.1 PEGA domain-containing protein [Fodinibius sediminis]
MYTISNSPFVVALTFLLATSTLGCATIFKGSSADIRVNSQPSNATVYINEIDKGTTPQTLSLDRDEDHILTFRKDGHEEVKVEIDKNFDGATTILGNIVSFALVGIVVDVATGAAYSLEPADVQANMDELKHSGLIETIPEKGKNEITVIMLTQEEWKKMTSKR